MAVKEPEENKRWMDGHRELMARGFNKLAQRLLILNLRYSYQHGELKEE